MTKVVVIGGGWAGCAAAISARKAGAKVVLIERTDLLLGLGNVGGLMRNNGRFTAAEECILLGGTELFEITDNSSRHVNVDFPGHKHASIYDVNLIEGRVRRKLIDMGIEIYLISKVMKVEMNENKITTAILENGDRVEGDVFIETTGSTGPMNNCYKYGNGCAMCVLRCPAFGGRVSITEKCGIKDMVGRRKDGTYGSFSGSVKLSKESLAEDIQERLNKEGVIIIPIPKEDLNSEKIDIKVCRQYATEDYAENIILLDTGHVKLMAPFYPLDKLRKIKGFENAKFEDPYAGGIGNSVRHFSAAPRDDYMKVIDIDNLFVAGEKSGFYIGHTEAIVTGYLAGHNSVRYAVNKPLLQLPDTLAIGDMISFSNKMMKGKDGDMKKFTFAGADYLERMKEKELYTTDKDVLRSKIEKAQLLDIYNKKMI